MNAVTVTLTRAEYDALMSVLARMETTNDSYAHFRTLERADLRDALRTLEAAGRSRPAAA
jgi:uncharacterized protein (DUF433 family)